MLATRNLEEKAEEVSQFMGIISNARRLLILCKLEDAGEMNVSRLVEEVGLSQSALSQHLAIMRVSGLVTTRKTGLTVHYRIADPRAYKMIQALQQIYCPPGA